MKKTITSLSQLNKFACYLADKMKRGEVNRIGLVGPLGAGKTTFVHQLTKALGITDKISSPTYTLMHEYKCDRQGLVHVDLYRLNSSDKESTEQIVEALNNYRFAVVEWADRIPEVLIKLDIVYYFSFAKNENDRIIEEKQ